MPALHALPSAAAVAACLHCGQPRPASRSDGFCCAGCHAVYRLLHESGLERYYDLKPSRTSPLLNYFERRPDWAWLDAELAAGRGSLELAIEGIQCGACVWAIQTLASRQGGATAKVNSALGRLSLRFDPKAFKVQPFLETLSDLGYRVAPPGVDSADPSRGLLLRLGICAAVSMNTMFFSLPLYLGLRDDASGLYPLLRNLNLGLTLVSLLAGGSYFFARAWAALRRGVAHFDIPVALGVAAAFAGSLWAHLRGQGATIYFDSVNLFLTFMLAGRYLQERALARQRRRLLKGEAFSRSLVTCLEGAPRDIPFPEVRSGLLLLLQPGSISPCEARLEEEGPLEFDLASVTGEPRPAALRRGATLPAGARLLSNAAARLRASADFQASLLARMDEAPAAEEELPVLWRWAVRWYVGLVLLAAGGGAAFWLWKDPSLAPKVFISTLVVTCPCGLGIAVPLARTLADRRLAACGLSLRQPGLLERALRVRQVCLDKTGTLTFSHLELANPAALEALSPEDRRALMGAAASSRHPVSRSIFRELSARGEAYPASGRAEEIPGQGVGWRDASGHWFLGRAAEAGAPARAAFTRGGRLLAAFELRERRLEDAPQAVQALRRRGLAVRLLSGDSPQRVQDLARELGLPGEAAQGGLGPQDKAAAVAGEPALMLGDGLNDGPALREALVSGTPAWERTLVADRADFSFASASLGWLPELFETAAALRRAVWANLLFAAVYNLGLLSFTLRGAFSPLLCAITMPSSSLLVIALTARSLRPK